MKNSAFLCGGTHWPAILAPLPLMKGRDKWAEILSVLRCEYRHCFFLNKKTLINIKSKWKLEMLQDMSMDNQYSIANFVYLQYSGVFKTSSETDTYMEWIQ
jgi:hypothetical protein